MGFDPSSIKKPKVTIDNLPKDANREDRVLALATQLHERGLTASVSDAKRIAEGMVATEARVIREGDPQGDEVSAAREKLRSSSLYASIVGSSERLNLPEDFHRFVDKAAHLESSLVPKPKLTRPFVPIPKDLPEKQVVYEEAPDLSETRGFSEQTTVDASADGVVTRREVHSEREESVEETGVIAQPAAQHDEDELKKQHGIDLFDVFKSG